MCAEPPKLKEYGSDQFLYKKEFGAVPQYLQRMKARHSAMMESLQQQEFVRPPSLLPAGSCRPTALRKKLVPGSENLSRKPVFAARLVADSVSV